jgi:benzoyl-CoA reductase/2-hydroxyglutaryl-CoA dehydratase subunit BcrC/BadD/HgdB
LTHATVGFTTTIPLEVLVAAGRRPVDLNNIFITAPDPQALIEEAEIDGFPRNICAWIKGLYGAVVRHGIDEVIAVTEGDCSNTRALMEVLSLRGTATIPFSYPHDRSQQAIGRQIDQLAEYFAVTRAEIEDARGELGRVRAKVHEIDRLSWEENRVSGEENNFYQLCTSDMNGDVAAYEKQVDAFLEQARAREPRRDALRLAYIGVPPIVGGLYEALEEMQARVVFNETQRQFSMPFSCADMEEQYLRYTYPYDIFTRLEDIQREVARRRIDGVIHYVQSFCFRQIEDLIVRRKLDVPVMTLEGDRPGPLDARGRIRLEGFVEMLKGRKA